MTGKKRVLFLSRDRGSIQAIAPVAARLTDAPDIEPLVLAFQQHDPTYAQLGLKPVHVEESRFFDSPVDFLGSLMDRYKPDLIVTGSSNPTSEPPETPEQYLALLGRERRIRTVAVLDAWGYYRERFGIRRQGEIPFLLPDLTCVLDRTCLVELVELGVPRERMEVTHNPWLDQVVEASRQSQPRPKQLAAGGLNILFLSQPLAEHRHRQNWPYTQHDLFRILRSAVSRLQTQRPTRIVVWLHPAEDQGHWRSALDAHSESFSLVASEERGPEMLAHVDAVVTSHSTVVYEALYFGTPCLMLRPGNPPSAQHLPDRLGLTMLVHDEEGLARELSALGTSRRQAVKARKSELQAQSILFNDGNATRRVTNAIRQMLKD